MLYSEGKKTAPRAGIVLARLVNPTTAVDVLVDHLVLAAEGEARAILAKSGSTEELALLIARAGTTVVVGPVGARLQEGEVLELRVAADAGKGSVVGSFINGQFDYPCSKPYGEERPIHDFSGVPEEHREKLLSRIAMPDAVHRNHCELRVGHDGDCGPLKKGS